VRLARLVVFAASVHACAPSDPDCRFADLDGDGYGDPTTCIADGVVVGDDCDDAASNVSPGEVERCDAVDNDCDGLVDDAVDLDLDGHDAQACGAGDDCNDADSAISPGAPDACGDAIDADCDGHDAVCQSEVPLSGGAFLYARAGDEAGQLVEAGDVDGDGHAEVFTATMAADRLSGGGWVVSPGVDAGEASIAAVSWRVDGVGPGEGAGRSIALGDANADGVEDVVIGAPFGGDCRVDVLFGPLSSDRGLADADASFTVSGPTTYCGHGSDLGDLDGDGAADLVVGAYASSEGGAEAGALYVSYGPVAAGKVDLASAADARWVGDVAAAWAGRVVRVADDLDGDGLADIVAAAVGLSVGGPAAGGVYLLFGAPSGVASLSDADARLIGEDPYDYAGVALATGDLDHDGRSDVVVGAQNSRAATAAGAAYVVFGGVSGDVDLAAADVIFRGTAASQSAGGGVAVGDVRGDGAASLVVGAPGDTAGMGGAWLYLDVARGSYSLDDADVRLSGAHAGGEAGWGLAIGDVNADGAGEILVGAPRDAVGGTSAGGLYVLALGR
jgi:hypothetical protein